VASDDAPPRRPFGFTGRVRSFRFAFRGIALMLRTQHNAWIHAAATVAVVAAGVALRVSAADWLWLAVAIVLVWVAEALNTAFEFLADATVAEFHPLVRNAKDVAAGAVLISAIGAATIGAIVLGDALWRLVW
jgi:diacylglycerol kinase (ATP)